MHNVSRSAAVILATLLVALTPLFAYADAGPKNELSVKDEQLLSAVDSLMGSKTADSNHGDIVSYANQNFQELVGKLGLSSDTKFTRGQIISMLARSDDGKANSGKSDDDEANAKADKTTPTATPTASSNASDEHKGQGKANEKAKANQGKQDDAESDIDSDDDDTAGTANLTATTPTATATATATPASETPTPTATQAPGNRGQGHRNGDR